MKHSKEFRCLQNEWYQKIETHGFTEIENTNHRDIPLKEWHSFKITSHKFQIMKKNRAEYQRLIDDFINHACFSEACTSMVKHGNCKFKPEDIALIWELHTQGHTTRKIANHMNRVKSRIDDVLKGLREWMKLM